MLFLEIPNLILVFELQGAVTPKKETDPGLQSVVLGGSKTSESLLDGSEGGAYIMVSTKVTSSKLTVPVLSQTNIKMLNTFLVLMAPGSGH
jgi:hypothetical protein